MNFNWTKNAGVKMAMTGGCLATLMTMPALSFDTNPTMQLSSSQQRYEADAAWRHAFGTMTVKTNRIAGLKRWQSMLARASRGCGDDCPANWRQWVRTTRQLATISPYAQLKVVNWLANEALTYRSDAAAFGVADYWASPSEALRGGGDCEDYVALKYLALRSAGFPEERLRIVILHDLRREQPHAVLVAQLNGRRLVLDNQLDDLALDTELAHYKPLYSFNERGKWVHLQINKRRNLAMVD